MANLWIVAQEDNLYNIYEEQGYIGVASPKQDETLPKLF